MTIVEWRWLRDDKTAIALKNDVYDKEKHLGDYKALAFGI